MSTRTTASLGLGVTVTLLGVIAITSFIAAVIFYGKSERLGKEIEQLREDNRTFVRADERNADWIQTRLNEASRAEGRPSLVSYLDRSLRDAMTAAAGDDNLSVTDLRAQLDTDERYAGADVSSLMDVVEARNATIAARETQIAELTRALETARTDLVGQAQLTERLREGHQTAVAATSTTT